MPQHDAKGRAITVTCFSEEAKWTGECWTIRLTCGHTIEGKERQRFVPPDHECVECERDAAQLLFLQDTGVITD